MARSDVCVVPWEPAAYLLCDAFSGDDNPLSVATGDSQEYGQHRSGISSQVCLFLVLVVDASSVLPFTQALLRRFVRSNVSPGQHFHRLSHASPHPTPTCGTSGAQLKQLDYVTNPKLGG